MMYIERFHALDDDVVGWKIVRGFPTNPGFLVVLSLWRKVMNREGQRVLGSLCADLSQLFVLYRPLVSAHAIQQH